MSDQSAFDVLHPVVQHHIVNTLGWRDLRPLQAEAAGPILRGEDALLLAPTAGGKTEAALFPLLSRAAANGWSGTAILYVCPLRALLNNLQPRVATYAAWLGFRAAVRHGDTTASARRRIAAEQPTVLMTTPESLEAMLVSRTIDPGLTLSQVRAVVVDEIHAFGGDDRGWHLLAVLERVAHLAGRSLQRVGLSATVGNPGQLLAWLQGSEQGKRPAHVVDPSRDAEETPQLQLDYVGSVANAAKVVATLHRGEKRLVFAESRARVEELAHRLRELDIETYVSHSSVSADERKRSEAAFAEAQDCVIVATSTLELGIDIGDLDRVIQIGAPNSVSSLLQRLGRTGRRPSATRNMLLLAIDDDDLIAAMAVLLLWSTGRVEPIHPPPSPRHLVAQQLLALALQHGQVGRSTWMDDWHLPEFMDPGEAREITDWMVETQHLDMDTAMLFIGPEAERRYGRRHFMDILSIFSAPPQFLVLNGRREIGTIDPYVLMQKVPGPKVITLAGRGWNVHHIDWSRRNVYVEQSESRGSSRWVSVHQPKPYELMQAERGVLLGEAPQGVELTRRVHDQLPRVRSDFAARVDADGTVVTTHVGGTRWWTWAGGKTNAVLTAALETVDPDLVGEERSHDNRQIGLAADAPVADIRAALSQARELVDGNGVARLRPFVSQRAIDEMKFSDMLPPRLAQQTVQERMSDPTGAAMVLKQQLIIERQA